MSLDILSRIEISIQNSLAERNFAAIRSPVS